MNTLIQSQQELRNTSDRFLRSRESIIQKIQVSFGYDRENAEKVWEKMQVESVEMLWGTGCGAFTVYKTRPIRREMAKSYGIFRKSWMRYPVPIAIFAAAYHVGTMLPTRFGRKLSWDPTVTHDTYRSSTDLVGRFRLFENDSTINSKEQSLAKYLATYSTEALTEPEILAQIVKSQKDEKKVSKWQVKRSGKDENDLFWTYGKIHGLENIVYLTKEQIDSCQGNPAALQILINNVQIPSATPTTFENQSSQYKDALDQYKSELSKLNLTSTDRKKMLALPFYMNKRKELPEPRKGQLEYQLFEEIFGMNWDEDVQLNIDPEVKITEFNYEEFIPAEILQSVDTQTDDFKNLIKLLNLTQKTRYERLQANKKQFRELMPLLAQLNEKEKRSFVHLLQSESSESLALNDLTSNRFEKELAQISERENYAIKNRYRHQRKTMDFADPKRMPIDESKVKDMLRNQHIFRDKMNSEIGTYQKLQDNPQMENGVLSYLNEAAYGDMKDLIRDVGINKDNIQFYNLAQIRKVKDNQEYESDNQFHYLMHALFTPLDMTDHEDAFVGWNELPGYVPMNRQSWLSPLQDEKHPQSNQLPGIEVQEKRPIRMTSPSFQAIVEQRFADPEEQEELGGYGEEDDAEDGEEGEEGEEGEGEGEGETADYGAEYDDEEPDTWDDWDEKIPHVKMEDRFFLNQAGKDTLRSNYSEVEIGSFMKILNVKPHKQWQDTSTHHYKLGVHDYEDEAQELDPTYHVLSEEERKAAERIKVQEWRRGQEIKLEVGDKRPIRYDYRF